MPSCIAGVESAFRARGEGAQSPSAVLGIRVGPAGFHAKAAFLELSVPYFAVKVNSNFPENPRAHSLPTIQGVLVLFDATNGEPLAIMDSMSITTLRTAATSAVAAKYLARADAKTATFIGCGVQGRAHVAAISCVLTLERVVLFDIDHQTADALANELANSYPFEISVAADLQGATRASSIIVTSTPSNDAFLGPDDVTPGAFIAAVGADNEHKHELHPELLTSVSPEGRMRE